MYTHALVLNGEVRKRHDFGEEAPPILSANKGAWLPLTLRGGMPEYDPETEACEPSETIGADAVTEGWAIRDLVEAELVERVAQRRVAIKVEARTRILAAYPDWKQTNMVARGVELQDAWRQNGEWTTGEQAEAAALQSAWTWIKAVRAASDALEISLPADFGADEHWPAS